MPPSVFDNLFAASARPMLMQGLGVDITITAPDETVKPVKAIVTGLESKQVSDQTGVYLVTTAVAEISLDPVEGIENPTDQHKATINGVVYNVTEVRPQNGIALLSLMHRDIREISRDAREAY